MGVSIQKTEERFNPRTEGWLGGFLRICKAGYMCWLGVLPGRVARPALYIATTANEDQYNPNQPTSNHEGTQPHKWTQCELCMNIEFLWPSFSSCEGVTDITAFAVDIGDNIFLCVAFFVWFLILIKKHINNSFRFDFIELMQPMFHACMLMHDMQDYNILWPLFRQSGEVGISM